MDRFKKVYSQGVLTTFEIWVDTETGVTMSGVTTEAPED